MERHAGEQSTCVCVAAAADDGNANVLIIPVFLPCLSHTHVPPPAQALLSRGDRRLTPLLLLVREYGDSLGSFKRAFKELQGTLPSLEYYVHETYDVGNTVLPWHHLHGPLPEATLVKHNADAQAEMGGG